MTPAHLCPYLQSSDVIDWTHLAVRAQAEVLAAGATDPVAIARRCFLWVRDTIQHSVDYRRNPVTCRASEVLQAGTGYCYAKSHLLVALLRARQIPAGLCYQRLSLDEPGPPFCLHGLAAVWLPAVGWYRVDPRGNRPGLKAEFAPPTEQLAYAARLPGEFDSPAILADPLPIVVTALQTHHTWDALLHHLPDVSDVAAIG